MKVIFNKYQGTGNDFVLIDNRNLSLNRQDFSKHASQLCDRRFGIGADGLILLQNKQGYDFEMVLSSLMEKIQLSPPIGLF